MARVNSQKLNLPLIFDYQCFYSVVTICDGYHQGILPHQVRLYVEMHEQ